MHQDLRPFGWLTLGMELVSVRELLDALFDRGASDVILSDGAPPMLRIDGDLERFSDVMLNAEDTESLARELLAPQQRVTLSEHNAVDFSFEWGQQGRVRGNAFRQRGAVAVALRAIPSHIPSFTELLLPDAVGKLATMPHGLVLFTGPTGAGKSTTQASLIDAINQDRRCHVITVEDPIEYVHSNRSSIIEQREVGVDTPSFASALRSALREDPDVVLVGEMRDLESISIALTVAETGHLVFATLHTNDAAQAIHRVVDVFAPEQQQQIRVQLGSTLLAVVHQQLLPRIGGGRVAAFEVLIANVAVRNLIRDNKVAQLRNVMVSSSDEGMCTLEAALAWLVRNGLVTEGDAVGRLKFPDEVTSHRAPYAPYQAAVAVEELAPSPPPLPVGVPSA
jgi:twitching motility protein PilT